MMQAIRSIPRLAPSRALVSVLLVSVSAGLLLVGCSPPQDEAPGANPTGSGTPAVTAPPGSAAPPAGTGQPAGAAPATAPEAAGGGNPLDEYIGAAGAYLASTQAEDGSWDYFHSRTPDFAKPEPHARLFGTAMVLMNLTHTGFEASQTFARGAQYLKERQGPRLTWALYEPGQFGADVTFEPDADDTAVALTVLAGSMPVSREQAAEVRAILDQHRAPGGLYRTYFDGFHGAKGFVPDPNPPSFGVNLNVLAFLGRYEMDRTRLVESLRVAMEDDRYWEKTPFYRSLPVLACLASNAFEHGAAEAQEILKSLLEAGDQVASDPRLHNLELAALVKARSHLCLLDADPCRDLDPLVRELAQRRAADGSWDPGPLYEYDVNHEALRAFVEGKGFRVPRSRGGFAYDVERALASPGAARHYDGSRAETTSFALKALVFYRELIARRVIFANMPREE
jgi:hypothetical protein